MSAQKLRMNLDRLGVFFIVMVLAMFGLTARARSAQDDHGAGIVFSKKAGAADVGLPIYPEARPYKDPSGDRDARLAAWGGGFGLRVAVVQLESSDAPAKIARYYKRSLAKYGPVLDCTKGGGSHADSSDALICDVEHPKDGEILFEAGTKENEHIVEVDPAGSGSTFSLVYLRTKGRVSR